MTRADYRNLRADQKNNDIVPPETASYGELWQMYVEALRQAYLKALVKPPNVSLTRTKDDSLTRREGE